MAQRHKVFISFHSADIKYKEEFERLFEKEYNVMISNSVQENDIGDGLKTDTIRQKIRDEYLKDSTITVVLIGKHTWQRKHVDWEIGSSIRDTANNPRSGLFGLFLPTHDSYKKLNYNPFIIPPRLYFNAKNGYASLYDWTASPAAIQKYIEEAFSKKDTDLPDNSYPPFANNRTTDKWEL